MIETLFRILTARARGDDRRASELLASLDSDDRELRRQLAAGPAAEPVVRLLLEHLRGQVDTMRRLAGLADEGHRTEAEAILKSAESRYAGLLGQLPVDRE